MSAPERIWAWTWNHKYPSKQNGKTQWNGSIYPSDPEHCATEYIRADLVQALVEALRDLMAIVEDARADVDVHAMDPGGAWLCGDEMHCRMGAARAALTAVGEGEP